MRMEGWICTGSKLHLGNYKPLFRKVRGAIHSRYRGPKPQAHVQHRSIALGHILPPISEEIGFVGLHNDHVK